MLFRSQRHSTQFIPGKTFDLSGACGPYVVSADEVGDASRLDLRTTVNGVEMQHATTADLIHGIPALIAYCSEFTTLEPGDVIATGTPGGVGYARTPPIFLVPGDVVEVHIDRCASCRQLVSAVALAEHTADTAPSSSPGTGLLLPRGARIGPYEIDSPLDEIGRAHV